MPELMVQKLFSSFEAEPSRVIMIGFEDAGILNLLKLTKC